LKNKEKVDFILYQMKLVLQRQDYVRLQILSKKINSKSIEEVGLEACKITYFKFLVKYHIHEGKLITAAKNYQTIYDSLNKASSDETLIKALDFDGEDRKSSFQNFALYLLISTHDAEKIELLNKVEQNYARELDKEPTISKLVRKLLTYELMPLDEKDIEKELSGFEPFRASTQNSK